MKNYFFLLNKIVKLLLVFGEMKKRKYLKSVISFKMFFIILSFSSVFLDAIKFYFFILSKSWESERKKQQRKEVFMKFETFFYDDWHMKLWEIGN